MKRENNNDEGNHENNKRSRRSEDTVRILIPSQIAGAIIGKGGQHIQKMRSQYKATVSVDDSQGPERTILISADLDSTLQIISEMLKYFEERDDETDFRLLIHQSLAGCVIGKGGQKIKEIRDKIGCRILKVFSSVAPQSTDRVVQIVGKQSQVVDAVREVVTLTRETPIKGPIHNYDPINFDRVYADEYGGYGTGVGTSHPSQRGGGSNRGGSGFNDRRGGSDRDGGGRGGRGGSDRGGFINPWSNDFGPSGNSGGFGGNNFGGGGGFGGNNFGSSGGSSGFGSGPMPNGNFNNGGGNFGSNMGSSSGFGNSGGGFGSNIGGGPMGGGNSSGFGGNQGFNGPNMGNGMGSDNGPNFGNSNNGPIGNNAPLGNLPNGHDPENSTQVTIPKDLAGAIIGKGGGRIRFIRNKSNAYITIDEPLPDSNDRIITISGTPKQIQMAQYLLQKSVHENSGRRNF